MPKDRAMMPLAKTTILQCKPSVITRQQALQAIFKAHYYTDCHPLVISTYMHADAQTPLRQFVVNIVYKHFCNKYSDKSNQQSLSFSA